MLYLQQNRIEHAQFVEIQIFERKKEKKNYQVMPIENKYFIWTH